MNILVINCGSSSLKYQLINSDTEAVLAKGLCERIGIDGSLLTHTPAGKDKVTVETPMPNHTVAVKLVIDALTDAGHGVVQSLDEINAVGHRVVHGGEKFASSVIINEEVTTGNVWIPRWGSPRLRALSWVRAQAALTLQSVILSARRRT